MRTITLIVATVVLFGTSIHADFRRLTQLNFK